MRTAPTAISVYNFSGRGKAIKDYLPGSDGHGPNSDKPHYINEINAEVWNVLPDSRKQELIDQVQQSEQLSGNGNLYLILQVSPQYLQ